MKKENTFAGIQIINKTAWTECFTEIYGDNGMFYAASNNTFAHNGSSNFKFRLCIEAMDSKASTGYGNDVTVAIYLVPDASSLCEKTIQQLMDIYGYKTAEEAVKELNGQEMIAAGFAVVLAESQYSYNVQKYPDGFSNVLEYAEQMVNDAASVKNYMLSYYPMLLSRTINLMGNNGWDMLDMALTGKEPAWAAIERIGNYNYVMA